VTEAVDEADVVVAWGAVVPLLTVTFSGAAVRTYSGSLALLREKCPSPVNTIANIEQRITSSGRSGFSKKYPKNSAIIFFKSDLTSCNVQNKIPQAVTCEMLLQIKNVFLQ